MGHEAPVSSPTRLTVPPQLVLFFGVLATSMSSTLVRLAQTEAHSLAIAAWRLTLATVMLAPFALSTRRAELRSFNRRERRWLLASGALLAVHFATWILSLALTSVAASVVLVAMSPLFVGLIAHFLFHERLSRETILGLLLALSGSVIITAGDFSGGAHQLQGDALALTGALAVAGYFLIGRVLRARISLLGYVFPVYGTAAVVLLLWAWAAGVPLTGFSLLTWLWLALLALFPQIIGHSSLNWSLGHLSATYVSLAVLGEPIGSTILAWVVLDEAPAVTAVVGGVLILAGLVIAGRDQQSAGA
ncbi:MAG TPA: DMT family transporter [Anaerolineae bacterium]|nr:DMT family transporter [Anaerolineae bacterium]HQJ12571.1 DMT family transporter [Anaerolineae bacterium]HUM37571.1 DMT family transporter [Anaerolineae bacterium]